MIVFAAILAPAVRSERPRCACAPDEPSTLSPHSRQAKSGQDRTGDASPTISVNVKLVSVFASVADAGGAPYGDLQKEDFRIFEDGIEQKLAVFERESGLPLSIVMALDTSMSTRKDLPLEIASARKFAHAMLRPVDSIALYQFSTYVSQAMPFTNDERRLDEALKHSANRRRHVSV